VNSFASVHLGDTVSSYFARQEAQLSPRDRAMRRVS